MLVSHEPFLQSRAQMLIMPASTDGNISHPVVARCKSLFADNYEHYHHKAMAGELLLGQALVYRLTKQTTGLGVQTSSAEYVGSLIAQKSPEHPISVRLFQQCLSHLKPQIYELMRYRGVRRVSLLGSALIVKEGVKTDGEAVQWLTAKRVVQSCHEILGDVPKLTIEVHFGKNIPLAELQKILES